MNEDRDEKIFLYAAGLLDDAERIRVEEGLRARGEEGQRTLARAHDALGHLALALAPVEPPAASRQELLDRAVREGARARLRWGSRSRTGPSRVLSSSPSRMLAALAASLLLAVSGGFGLAQWLSGTELAEREDEIARLSSSRAELEAQLERVMAAATEHAEVLAAKLAGSREMAGTTNEDLLQFEAELETSRAQVVSLREDILRRETQEASRVRELEVGVERLEQDVAVLSMQRRDLALGAEESESSLRSMASELQRARSIISMLERDELAELTLVAAVSEATADTAAHSAAHADLLWELDDRLCYLRAWQLPAIADEYRYALWVVDEVGRVGLIGTFAPDVDGQATLFANLPESGGLLADSYVTLERAPVDQSPIGPRVMNVSVEPDEGKRRPKGPYNKRRRPGVRRSQG